MKDTEWNVHFGSNVQDIIETEECRVMKLSDESGEGVMTLYSVFPGAYIIYNDFHMQECVSGFMSERTFLSIDHCREGGIETEVKKDTFSYLSDGELFQQYLWKANFFLYESISVKLCSVSA